MAVSKYKPPTKKERIRNALELLFIAMIAFGLSFILINKYYDYKSERSLRSLQDNVKSARDRSDMSFAGTMSVGEVKKGEILSESNSEDKESAISRPESSILNTYKELHSQNENFYGWLYIADTPIDYPVMKGPDNEFYLSHNLERKYDKYGMLILDYGSDDSVKSPHLIIYGHNVHNGDLFGELINYKDHGYYSYHPTINFDSLYETDSYEIFAVFRVSLEEAQKDEALFTTYKYEDKDTFDSMLKYVKDKSIYKIDKTPEYGDTILSLVTCEYTKKDGRFVVMAYSK